MTYVSRRARITVPRWPNDSDPEFLFRVGRRCDGRLKRHSSCHDLRAWINDNCIKNEYLLDLMSDGEVTIRPPLELYGRFIPVPLLFKLLQNSRSESGPEDTDWEKIFSRSATGVSDGEKILPKSATGVSDGERAKKASALEPTYAEKIRKARESGIPFVKGDKSKGSGTLVEKESSKIKWKGAQVEETHSGTAFDERGVAQPTSGKEARKTGRQKWEPFDKMEYYTSGYASKGALVEGVCPRPTSTQSTLVIDDNYENSKSKYASQKPGSEGSLARIIWEKDVVEKNLFRSTCLLTKALGKLEKIDNIIQVGNDEREKMRKGEIQEAFQKPTINCIYLQGKNTCKKIPLVKYRVKSPGDVETQATLKCNELLRQISGLREKLKKNQESQQRVNQEITMSQKEPESGPFPHITEMGNSEGEAQLRKLQKRLEKLINHRGKLLSEMCQALTQLNNIKRCRNSRLDVRQQSRSGENRSANFGQEQCTCPCRVCQSSESERAHCSESASSSDNYRRPEANFNRDDDKTYSDYTSTDNLDSGQQNFVPQTRTTDTLNEAYASNKESYRDNRQDKDIKKSILKFCCRDQPCLQELDKVLNASEKYFRSGQRPTSPGPTPNTPTYRPSTSPTTKKEKRDASEERQFNTYETNSQEIPERRVKSETTMKEIEKTLRNYEQRLSDMDGLEYKVEEWKRKLLEGCRWRKTAAKMEEHMKREQENERNRASTHINGLFTQNYELKKQVRQLTDKSKEQAKKIQNMKSSIMRARELENEAEELKKELSEYRNSYEHQRKCITKWESVVALQRKEIENLMNHIRKLTTEKKEQATICCQEKRFIQRTRSCSPVAFVDCQAFCRPETYNARSDEENGSCCCQDFRQPDSRRTQLRFFDKNYYSSLNEKEDWCN